MLTQEVVFRVVWVATGEPVTDDDLEAIALKAPWDRGLVYSDIEGFAVTTDGELILLDECGNYVYPPPELFRVDWLR
jgi:hypothetical protein